jgi:MoaA/NifB/PqqE/SkfB family radical SAM enzyme
MTSRKAFHKYLFREEDGSEMCDKKSPFLEILFRLNAYSKLSIHALRAGIPLTDLIRARYPYRLPEPAKPTMLSLEFCNVCDLACSYCPTHDDKRSKGYMSNAILTKVIEGVLELKINRVHIRGWGEPTRHPKFGEYVRRLGKAIKYSDIVTNGQWKDEGIIHDLLTAPVHRIDVSVDAGGLRLYEETRKGGSYERVLKNLKRLKTLRNQLKSKSVIIVRSMFRPSQVKTLKKEMAFMREYADAVIPAPIFKKTRAAYAPQYGKDIYTLTAVQEEYPRCYFPLNELSVSWNGIVPLCDNLVLTHDEKEIFAGNVLERPLPEIWKCDNLRNLRLAHKRNVIQGRAICKGCTTC